MTDKKPTSISIHELVENAINHSPRNEKIFDGGKLLAALNAICGYVEKLEQRIADLEEKSKK